MLYGMSNPSNAFPWEHRWADLGACQIHTPVEDNPAEAELSRRFFSKDTYAMMRNISHLKTPGWLRLYISLLGCPHQRLALVLNVHADINSVWRFAKGNPQDALEVAVYHYGDYPEPVKKLFLNNYWTWEALAASPHTSEDMLLELLHSNMPGVNSALVLNPNLSPELLKRVFMGQKRHAPNWDLAKLARNPALPVEALIWAVGHSSSESVKAAATEVLSTTRWEEFQAWLKEKGLEEFMNVPPDWVANALT